MTKHGDNSIKVLKAINSEHLHHQGGQTLKELLPREAVGYLSMEILNAQQNIALPTYIIMQFEDHSDYLGHISLLCYTQMHMFY